MVRLLGVQYSGDAKFFCRYGLIARGSFILQCSGTAVGGRLTGVVVGLGPSRRVIDAVEGKLGHANKCYPYHERHASTAGYVYRRFGGPVTSPNFRKIYRYVLCCGSLRSWKEGTVLSGGLTTVSGAQYITYNIYRGAYPLKTIGIHHNYCTTIRTRHYMNYNGYTGLYPINYVRIGIETST